MADDVLSWGWNSLPVEAPKSKSAWSCVMVTDDLLEDGIGKQRDGGISPVESDAATDKCKSDLKRKDNQIAMLKERINQLMDAQEQADDDLVSREKVLRQRVDELTFREEQLLAELEAARSAVPVVIPSVTRKEEVNAVPIAAKSVKKSPPQRPARPFPPPSASSKEEVVPRDVSVKKVSEPKTEEAISSSSVPTSYPVYTVVEVTEDRPRALKEKLKLLELALRSGDTNTVHGALLFLHSTLKWSLVLSIVIYHPFRDLGFIFCHLLSVLRRKSALRELLHAIVLSRPPPPIIEKYFPAAQAVAVSKPVKMGKRKTLSDVPSETSSSLRVSSVIQEGLMEYESAMRTTDIPLRGKLLQSVANYFEDPFCVKVIGQDEAKFYASIAREAKLLVERQLSIEHADSRAAASGAYPLFVKYPRKSILGESLARTLHYCMFYHWNAHGRSPCSPENLRRFFHIDNARYVYTALAARSLLMDWDAVQNLIERSTFKRKKKSPIGFEPFVRAVAIHHGPRELAETFLSYIEPVQERLRAAVTYGLYEAAVPLCVELGDYLELENVRRKSQEILGTADPRAEAVRTLFSEAVRAPKQRWKNQPPQG